LWTIHEQGFQVEQGVDNFITTLPWGLDLCRRLGLEDQLVQTNPDYRRTYVVRSGRLHLLPDGFLMMAPTRMWPLVVTPLLSPLGKLRCALEYFIPRRKTEGDESMASFVRRRLGREAYERLVEPLVSAVYAADLEKLSVEATLSRFRDMEREHGSLVRAMRRQMKARRKGAKSTAGQSGPRFSMFVTLREGLSSLVEAIVAKMPQGAVRVGTPVERLEPQGDGWKLTLGDGSSESFDAVILAAPSYVASELLAPLDKELSRELGTITHSSTAVLTAAFERERVNAQLQGMGIVVPATERSPILACSLSNLKYTHRAPEDTLLVRVFVGGSRYPEMAAMDEAELWRWPPWTRPSFGRR
jgi:oxygen-dependent protoporphyrinogen oxidase